MTLNSFYNLPIVDEQMDALIAGTSQQKVITRKFIYIYLYNILYYIYIYNYGQIAKAIAHSKSLSETSRRGISSAVIKFIDEISSVNSDLFEFIHYIDKHVREGLTEESHSLSKWSKSARGITTVVIGLYCFSSAANRLFHYSHDS